MIEWKDKVLAILEFLDVRNLRNVQSGRKPSTAEPYDTQQLFRFQPLIKADMESEPGKFAETMALQELDTINKSIQEFMNSTKNLALSPYIEDVVDALNSRCEKLRATATGLLADAARDKKDTAKLQEIEGKRAKMFSDIYNFYKKNGGKEQ